MADALVKNPPEAVKPLELDQLRVCIKKTIEASKHVGIAENAEMLIEKIQSGDLDVK